MGNYDRRSSANMILASVMDNRRCAMQTFPLTLEPNIHHWLCVTYNSSGDSDHDNLLDSDEEPLIEPDSDVCCCSEHSGSDSDVLLNHSDVSCCSEHTDSDSDVSYASEQTMDWADSDHDCNRVSRFTSLFEMLEAMVTTLTKKHKL